MSTYSTPRSRKTSNPSTPARTTSAIAPPSPHYVTTRRHSLYGTEDRVIIDPGSRVWKIGFSGESRPRAVFRVHGRDDLPLWTLNRASISQEEEEEEHKILYSILQVELRKVFHKILQTDPKSRKVIIVEHPLLPVYIKEMLGRILFENLLVPSVSFAPSGLLSLVSVGRTTGIVVDCGHLETCVLPFYSSRPLYPHIQTTPLAGMRLNSHIRALLLLFAQYYPPPSSFEKSSLRSSIKPSRVPEEILTDDVIEEIKTRCCYVGDPIPNDVSSQSIVQSGRSSSPPPSSDPVPSDSEADVDMEPTDPRIMSIDKLYRNHSRGTELRIQVKPLASQQIDNGFATVVLPGWIRERAAELLFEDGDLDEQSVVEVVLRSLRRIPIDLRRQLASNILVTGGTAMLPGFAARLSKQLKLSLGEPRSTLNGRRRYDPFSSIRLLRNSLSVINDPSAQVSTGSSSRAPAFSPALLAWVGGSLSGALKITSHEMLREKWDETIANMAVKGEAPHAIKRRRPVMYDWMYPPLPVGAPIVNIAHIRPQVSI